MRHPQIQLYTYQLPEHGIRFTFSTNEKLFTVLPVPYYKLTNSRGDGNQEVLVISFVPVPSHFQQTHKAKYQQRMVDNAND